MGWIWTSFLRPITELLVSRKDLLSKGWLMDWVGDEGCIMLDSNSTSTNHLHS
jgi:hypothetical protein